MLTEDRIKDLVESLEEALVYERHRTVDLENVTANLELEKAKTLAAHEFTGKNAESRAWEATALLAEDDDIRCGAGMVQQLTTNLALARVDVECARARIKLYAAMAQQNHD